MRKYVIAAICVLLTAIILIVCNLQKFEKVSVSSLHIDSDVIRLESDMSKKLNISVYPETAIKGSYELVSENEFVAICEDDKVVAVNEGETFVYAVARNGKVESNRVKVIVNNNIFDVATKIIMASVDQQTASNTLAGDIKENSNLISGEENRLGKVEVTSKAASQITGANIEEVPETFDVPAVTDENANEIVYVTKSGDKFHLQTCTYAKGATTVSRSQAVADGKKPCKKCKP